jgi:hypothetical protein
MSVICNHCGYDIDKPGPVARGDCSILEDGHVILRGRLLGLSPLQSEIFHALMRGKPLRRAVLADRLGTTDNAVSTHVHFINRKFEEAGADAPIACTPLYHIV